MPLDHLPNELILMIAENLKSSGDLNSLIQTNIHLSENGNENTARKSLQAGVELDCCVYWGWGQSLLCLAAENGNDGVLKLFLASNESVDPDEENSDGETPLVCAAKWGHEVVVKQLLLTGRVDVNFVYLGFTPLCHAAWNGHKAVVNLLLDAEGINLDFAHSDGRTAIDLAAESRDKSIVNLLIAAGATVTDMPGTNQTCTSTQMSHQEPMN
ncbi:unnamed protein product [Penicillium viridicatum]